MAIVSTISNYLKTHEKLLIWVLGFALVWDIAGKIDHRIDVRDAATLQADKATSAQDKINTDKTAAIIAQQTAAYNALAAKTQATDAALAQANIALASALAQRQHTDDTLTSPELARRWTQLVPLIKPSDITFALDPNGQLTLTDDAAHKTVDQLEQVPVLTAELANEKTIEAGTNALLLSANGRIDTLYTQVGQLTKTNKDDTNTCQAEIKIVKDDARKSKRHWLYAGIAIGFAGRQAIKTYLHF